MRYLIWILRLALFIVVLLFALKNTGPVDVALFADKVVTDVPLIVVMLGAFIPGVLLGLLIALPSILRARRETAKLRRDLVRMQDEARQASRGQPGAEAAELVAPIAPL